MARTRTEVGTYGTIVLTGQVKSGRRHVAAAKGERPTRWRAGTKFRDADGVLRDVERYAQTKARAEADLKRALTERHAHTQSGEMRATMALAQAGEIWLKEGRAVR